MTIWSRRDLKIFGPAELKAEKTRAEFETASKLSHPNILKVLHVFRYQEKENNGILPGIGQLDNYRNGET